MMACVAWLGWMASKGACARSQVRTLRQGMAEREQELADARAALEELIEADAHDEAGGRRTLARARTLLHELRGALSSAFGDVAGGGEGDGGNVEVSRSSLHPTGSGGACGSSGVAGAGSTTGDVADAGGTSEGASTVGSSERTTTAGRADDGGGGSGAAASASLLDQLHELMREVSEAKGMVLRSAVAVRERVRTADARTLKAERESKAAAANAVEQQQQQQSGGTAPSSPEHQQGDAPSCSGGGMAAKQQRVAALEKQLKEASVTAAQLRAELDEANALCATQREELQARTSAQDLGTLCNATRGV
jgi:hypothetical protein